MARKKYSTEDIISLLRQAEVFVSKGQTTEEAAKSIGISYQTYCRWKKEYGGLRSDQAKRLKELEIENSRLKRIVADLELDKLMLKEIAEGNF